MLRYGLIRHVYQMLARLVGIKPPCKHTWVRTMANVKVDSGTTDMLTLCSSHCDKCGVAKLECIYPNK